MVQDHGDLRIKRGGHRGGHDEHDLEDRGLALHGDRDEHHDEVHGKQGLVNQFGKNVDLRTCEGSTRTIHKGMGYTHRLHESRRDKR